MKRVAVIASSIVALGTLVFFGADLKAMWQAPEVVEELAESVEDYVSEQRVYVARQEVREEKQDYLIELLTTRAIVDNPG